MDSDSPIVSRVERTFWTVWNYITGAVNRFLRPDPAQTVSNDPDSIQESAVDHEPAKYSHAEDEASDRGAEGEQTFMPPSLHGLSRSSVAWDVCTTEIDLGPDEENSSEVKESERDEDISVEDSALAGHEPGLLVAEDENAKEDEEVNQELRTNRHTEMLKTDENGENVITGPVTEDMGGTEEETLMKIQDEEEVHEIERDNTEIKLHTVSDLCPKEEETNTQRNKADSSEVQNISHVIFLSSDDENKPDEGTVKNDCEELSNERLQMVSNTSIPVYEELVVTELEQVTALRNENDKSDDEEEKKDGSEGEEGEQEVEIKEEKVNKIEEKRTLDDVPEQKDETETVREEAKEEEEEENSDDDERTGCSNEVLLTVETELLTEGRQKDVVEDTSVKIKVTGTDDVEIEGYDAAISDESGVQLSNIPAEERCLDKDQVQEGNKETYMEHASSFTVTPEEDAGQEESLEFKNIPESVFKGRSEVPWEPIPPTCEETQEGVPDNNNEPEPDENTTQWFLEVMDSEEVQTTQFPEEVETEETESLQNSVRNTGADLVEVREQKEQESSGDSESTFDLFSGDFYQGTRTPLSEPIAEEAGPFSVEEDKKLSVALMKTGIHHSEKEPESDFSLISETDLQDETEELLDKTDDGLFDLKEADAAQDCFMMTETAKIDETVKLLEAGEQMTETCLQEPVDTVISEQNKTSTLIGDFTDTGFLTQQDARKDSEKASYGDVQEAAEREVEVSDLEVAGEADEVMTEENEMENSLIAERVLSGATESPETKNAQSDLESAHDTETTQSKPKAVTMTSTEEILRHVTESEESYDEERLCSVNRGEDVIDEEILDMWMETLSEDNEKQQEGPEVDSSREKQTVEQLVESKSGESEFVSDTEMSLSTTESGFSDQSLSEWGTQSSDPQLQRSTGTGPIKSIFDTLVDVSELVNISAFTPEQHNSESPDTSTRGTYEIDQSSLKDKESETGFRPDSAEVGYLQESEEPQEHTDEKSGSWEEINDEETGLLGQTVLKNTEEADINPLTEVDTLFEVEETKIEAEALDKNLPDPHDENKHADSVQTVSSLEAWSEEGILFDESGSEEEEASRGPERSSLNLPSPDELQTECAEDIHDSVSDPNEDEEPEDQLTTTTEYQTEVDVSGLDFTAQRSRIAVKNPLVRPPKDPRSLIHLPSLDPTPAPRQPAKVPAVMPLGGMGIGIKLPGLGAGFPVLKKTRRPKEDDSSPENNPQEPERKPEEKSDAPKQDEIQHKPKWMPPRHPGFGNPLMSELKTKLKKPTQD
ncbi:uncharacterized protein si:ch211-136m16.8 [Xyrichtys novacula]|uniref:Uncharacterized protein si:ch211-136m16.8 n=1 Tax=Xyrichtys novacula TaxID=13765 RepID=A0AAV1H354_XYRNO|nr:uncharacterized protein si:ch211-136m16.8 [Xyrichtys novacula]